MTVVEHDGRLVIVDTGLMFPTAEMLGIDLVLPDFSSLRERIDDIEAIVLTHGHEDHVGALPYVLREIGMPPVIYGGALTIGLVRSKLEEHKIRDAPLEVLEPGERDPGRPLRHRDDPHVALDPRLARGRAAHRARRRARHRRLQVRPDPGRDGARPTSPASPSSAASGCSASAATRPTPTAPGSRRRSRPSARRCSTRSPAARAGSSSPASPPTSTASSR